MPVAVSVVVPTFARPDALDDCLGALGRQDFDGRFEVVVVDDGSPETLDTVVDGHRASIDVALVRQRNAGPAAARNAGVERASGRLLAFTDDDCTPAPGWLTALTRALDGNPAALVGGRTVNALAGNLCAEASQALVSYLDRAGEGRDGQLAFATSNNLGVEAEGFAGIGGFDAAFSFASEDRDLCDRWRLAGGSLRRASDAVVRHHHDMGFGDFWRQHVGYGRGARQYHAVRAARGQPPLRVEPARFYASMMSHPIVTAPGPRALPVAALIGLSQVATAAGFALEGRRLATEPKLHRVA